jgi:hypothetical protein
MTGKAGDIASNVNQGIVLISTASFTFSAVFSPKGGMHDCTEPRNL